MSLLFEQFLQTLQVLDRSGLDLASGCVRVALGYSGAACPRSSAWPLPCPCRVPPCASARCWRMVWWCRSSRLLLGVRGGAPASTRAQRHMDVTSGTVESRLHGKPRTRKGLRDAARGRTVAESPPTSNRAGMMHLVRLLSHRQRGALPARARLPWSAQRGCTGLQLTQARGRVGVGGEPFRGSRTTRRRHVPATTPRHRAGRSRRGP
jgi:hypothetical protein